MADKHESLKWQVINDWTKQKRGRLYCCNQGLAFPAREVNGELTPADFPLWFGPLKRSFKGFPDLFGFELLPVALDANQCELLAPIFTTIEVKTKKDIVRSDQKRVMNYLSSVGCRCYIARETDEGYSLERWIE